MEIQHEILVAVASGTPLLEVMSLLCVRAQEIAPKAICSILRIDSAGRLRPLAAPSLPDSYSALIDGLPIGPEVGSCGTAAYLGEAVEVTDIKTDSRWGPYKDAPLALGLKACWSSPIKSHDARVVGTFAFYFRTSRRPTRLEQRIVARCTHLCALAIEHATAQNRVRRLAFTDPLTGLGNRASVAEQFPAVIERAWAAGKQVALYYVDLDGFRAVNDIRGHKVADRLLACVGHAIRSVSDGAELVARLGGDEFLIVESHSDAGEFDVKARALSEALCARFVLGPDIEVKIGASIGIASFPRDGTDLDALMGFADTALRSVKSSGRSGYAFYAARMDAEERAQRAFERDILSAVAARQLSVVFQPQADTRTCAVRGFEALLRWNHPEHGNVSPGKFIPAAEACGAIVEIGAFVLREALSQAAKWPKHLRVAVNVSPAQIVQENFAQFVEDALAESGVEPSRLEIEVTESLFIFEPDMAMKTLEQLSALGVSVAMDDFGTGYSSLSTLRAFPFDRIKIDRSFVFDMVGNKKSAAIVNAIMGLGRAMGRPVVAEGVETREQLELLRELGCDEVQGYLIGKPQAIETYADITEQRRPRRKARKQSTKAQQQPRAASA